MDGVKLWAEESGLMAEEAQRKLQSQIESLSSKAELQREKQRNSSLKCRVKN